MDQNPCGDVVGDQDTGMIIFFAQTYGIPRRDTNPYSYFDMNGNSRAVLDCRSVHI